jgi:hypothetical protein
MAPLLGKDLETNNETAAVAMQRRCKHASTTIELLLFSTRSVQRGYKENNWGDPGGCQLRVESPAMSGRLYVCCNYSETVIMTMLKSVVRTRKTEET